MSSTNTLLQERVKAILELPGILSIADLPIALQRPGEKANSFLQTVAKRVLGIIILPVLPTKVREGEPDINVEEADLRLRIHEHPNTNPNPLDAYELAEELMLALHWEPTRTVQKAIDQRMEDEGESLEQAKAWAATAPELQPYRDLGEVLGHPLYLAAHPLEVAEGVNDSKTFVRVLDVIFKAKYALNPAD